MSSTISNSQPTNLAKGQRLKRGIIPLLTLGLVIAISVSFFFYGRNLERVAELKNYGYLGAFLIALIGNATVLLPLAVLPILIAISVILYPVTGPVGPLMVGLAGGVGAAIGEIAGYTVGYSGRGVVKNTKLYLRLVEWMKRWGTLAIFIFALLPFFFDLAGLAAGVLRFPLWKFILTCWLGRTLNYVSLNLLTAWGWEVGLRYFG